MNPIEKEALLSSFKEANIPPELVPEFLSLWSEKQYSKGTWITEAGRTEPYFYYVLEGVQMVYYLTKQGEQTVLGFSYQGDYSGAYESFLMQQPSQLFLEALLPSRMLAISYDDYYRMFDRHPGFDRWSRLFLERILIGRSKRELELVNLSAKERYIQFMQRCPDELHRIPQKYLASYLNMKPETFSRFRSTVQY